MHQVAVQTTNRSITTQHPRSLTTACFTSVWSSVHKINIITVHKPFHGHYKSLWVEAWHSVTWMKWSGFVACSLFTLRSVWNALQCSTARALLLEQRTLQRYTSDHLSRLYLCLLFQCQAFKTSKQCQSLLEPGIMGHRVQCQIILTVHWSSFLVLKLRCYSCCANFSTSKGINLETE